MRSIERNLNFLKQPYLFCSTKQNPNVDDLFSLHHGITTFMITGITFPNIVFFQYIVSIASWTFGVAVEKVPENSKCDWDGL